MTDDISKAVRRFRGVGELEREGYIPAGSATERDRLESATTPAEADAPGIDTANHAGVRVRGYTVEQYAALARQLAKSERDCAELRALLTAQNAAIARTDDLARQLAEANSELAMHRVDATRVAACPWRVQKGHTSECQPPKRLQDALDQLAEANRRLGEVEGLLKLWLEGEESGDYMTQKKAREQRDVALQQEAT